MSIKVQVIKSREVNPTSSQIRTFARKLLQNEGIRQAEINVVFVDDNYIKELNRRFLQVDAPTDVLSFPLESEDGRIEGEIYISVDTAREQAREYHVPLEEELMRLVAHGLLHLLGYDDQTSTQKAEMTRKEEEYLSSFRARANEESDRLHRGHAHDLG